MSIRKIFFVAGVHGVGKGTLCNRLISLSQIDHVAASDLIRKRKELNKRKGVNDLLDNQELLIQELNEFKSINKILLLDGHFCLFNSEMKIINIPIEFYKKINISKILLIVSKSEIIYQRILSRDKDESGLNLTHISALQKAEIEYAEFVSSYLKIPLIVINHDNHLTDIQLQQILNDF